MGTSPGNVTRTARPALSASRQALLRKRVQGAFKALDQGSQIPRRSGSGPTPLSFAQQRLWFLQQLEPASPAYNVATGLRLKGPLDTRAFGQALNLIQQRHEILRSTFPAPEGDPVQVVSPEAEVKLAIVDLEHLPSSERESAGSQVLQEQARKPFDILNGPVTRYTLVRFDAEDHLFSMVMHHIVIDGWAVTLFFRELEALYDSLTRMRPAELPPCPIQYGDFSVWQRETLRGERLDSEVKYWKTKLTGAPPAIDLPTDHDEHPTGPAEAASRSTQLSQEFCGRLGAFARAHGATDFMVLTTALAITLQRWCGQRDVVIGTVAAGRTRREIENLSGCFMNFLPLRVQMSGDAAGAELLSSVKTTVLEAYAHQDCPFDKIVEAINPARGVHRNPLYNVALLLQNFPTGALSSDVLSAQFLPVETNAAMLDLRFVAEHNEQGMLVLCEYDTALFEPRTVEKLLEAFREVMVRLVETPEARIGDHVLPEALNAQSSTAHSRRQVQTIAVAATFTADPVEGSISYWLNELEISGKVTLAPYNQVFQQVLDPSSGLNQNHSGVNMLLVRVEDWAGGRPAEDSNLSQTVREFCSALKAATARSTVPWLVCICPVQEPRDTRIAAHEKTLLAELQAISGVHLLTASEMLQWYPVEQVFDSATDRLGNVPYTPLFFAALGTALMRKSHALKRAPRKVIALDCDNTLWEGVCGEDGPQGIRFGAERKALQEFMRRQAGAGMLLCLCTKNNEGDVEEVFKCRSDFSLRRDSFVAARVNWRSKSENLKALARELQVGLDSFIFVDDNPMECAEVEANCPGVLTLLLPENPGQIPKFLEHAWVFDHLKVTEEDKKRARLYRENRKREELRAQCVSMADFLAGLNLQIRIEPARPEQFARISQLTQRTNQFNFTTRRYSENEIQQWSGAADAHVFAVSVSDRFGDYGLVGVLIARAAGETLDVDTFLLSCRVLGKGVEYRMLARLGELAQSGGLRRVDLHFRASAKNRPALDFLEKTAASFRQNNGEGSVFRLPARLAAGICYRPEDLEQVAPTEKAGEKPGAASELQPFKQCRAIALNSNDPNGILEAVEKWARSRQSSVASAAPYAAPRTKIEQKLCEMWQSLLGVERIGVHDDFFALGGTSILAVRLFAQIEKVLGKALPLVVLFQCPTIEQLAQNIEERKEQATASSIVPIQTAGSKPPLVLVHGAGGGILWGYANLAAHLGQDQPVYAIEPRLAAAGQTSLTVEQMAAQYLADLRAFQPQGPYYIGGYCFGGYVAYEMARLLREANEKVNFLALIDSAAPNGSYDRIPWWNPLFYFRFARNTFYWVQDFLGLSRYDQWTFIKRKLGVVKRKLFRSRPKKEVDIRQYIDTSYFPEEELRLWQVHLNAGGAYKPAPYEGCVTLVRTCGQPFLCSFDPKYGWGELARGGVKIRIVPGSHEAIFVEPDVRSLAAQIAACIRETKIESE
jgi:FkbH-like protein